VLPSCAAAVILFLLPIPTAAPALLIPAATPSLLPVYFPHEKHTTVDCVTCHHNFVDKTGLGSCRDCHRSARPDLPESAEATFHTFCRNCHTELAETTTKHGPTRACSTCHAKEPPPVL
jgi:predicted CXXCH cytochrome family protein